MEEAAKAPARPLKEARNGVKGREYENCEQAGQYLKHMRTRRTRTLKDVAASLRVQPHHIACIEAGGMPDPPGLPYALGMVRSYVRYLGLDPEPVVRIYKLEHYPRPRHMRPAHARDEGSSILWKILAAALLAIIAWGSWNYYEYRAAPPQEYGEELLSEAGDPEAEDGAAVFSADIYRTRWSSSPRTADGALVLVTADTGAVSRTRAEGDRIVLEALDDCWIEVASEGGEGTVLERLLRRGQRLHLDDVEGMVLSVGNAGGLAIYWNDRPLRRIGDIGQFLEGVPLDSMTAWPRLALTP